MTWMTLGVSVGKSDEVIIYHLLGAALGQGVAVAQVVDLDVLDEVAVLLIDFCVQRAARGWSFGGGFGSARLGGRALWYRFSACTYKVAVHFLARTGDDSV